MVSLMCAGLAACDSAGPGFRGVEKTVSTVEGSTFTLRRQGDVIEAIRTNPERFPTFQPIARKAGLAAQQLSGCEAAWVVGDPSMMWVGLACEGRKAPPQPKKRKTLSCDFYDDRWGGSVECELNG